MRTRRTGSAHLALLAAVAAAALASQAVPVSAAVGAMAAGELQANVSISPFIPRLAGLRCGDVTFGFNGGGQAVANALGGVDSYVGPITFTGSGSSQCSDTLRDLDASLSLTVSPVSNFSGGVSCPLLTGSLLRIGAAVSITVSGACTLNSITFNSVFESQGVLEPVSGDGVTTGITSAVYYGSFQLAA